MDSSGVDTKYQCAEEFLSMEQAHHLHGGTIQTVHVQLLVQNEESYGI